MLIWTMFIVYILLSAYILWRMIHWLKIVIPLFKHKRMQAILIGLYLAFASTIIFGGLCKPSPFKIAMKKIGNYWLGTLIYIIFFIIVVEIIVLILKQIHKRREVKLLSDIRGYYTIGIFVFAASVVFSIGGFMHAHNTVLTTYDITVDKRADKLDNLKVALVADLHLGYSVGYAEMQKMVKIINKMEPDLVVIAGDIFDNDYNALDNPDKLISILKEIQSKYGVYAVYGNHDVEETLIGGFSVSSEKLAYRDPRMDEFLNKCGFSVLEDEVVTIADNSIYLVGRLDIEKAGDGTSNRKDIETLTAGLDKTKPIILIEHQPENLEEIAAEGVDVMLSGHTHAGQFFPLTLVQGLRWQNHHGLLKVGNMNSLVTSGVGLYGPNMRVLTDSEVMEVNIQFLK